MTPFFRYPAPGGFVQSVRYGRAIVLAVLFSVTIIQIPALSPDTLLNPLPWRCLIPGTARADMAADFNEKFEALIPPKNSSVHSDYLFEQIALGSRYTVMQLEQIRGENAAAARGFEKLSQQLETLIEQNQQIIELLEKENDL